MIYVSYYTINGRYYKELKGNSYNITTVSDFEEEQLRETKYDKVRYLSFTLETDEHDKMEFSEKIRLHYYTNNGVAFPYTANFKEFYIVTPTESTRLEGYKFIEWIEKFTDFKLEVFRKDRYMQYKLDHLEKDFI